jgi:hypothetical protein
VGDSGVVFEEAEVDVTVGGGEEDVAAGVSALGDVVGALGDDDAGESGHMGGVAGAGRGSQRMWEMLVCPGLKLCDTMQASKAPLCHICRNLMSSRLF